LGAAGEVITESLDVPVQGELWKEQGPVAPIITKGSAVADQLLTLRAPPTERSSLADLEHPVTAYLNGLAPSSRRPQLAALEAIARRSTQVFTAETMPWPRLRRHQVLKIRSLLEENYLPATANRMLSALRGVLKECWHSGRLGMEEYRLAVDVEPVRGESEPRGRDLSAAELRSLLEACARAPQEVRHSQDSVIRRRRDAAFLSLLYASGLRRAEAVALELADLDHVSGQLRVRRGKGRKPRLVSLPASALPSLQDWLEVRSDEPGPLFSAVLKNGRLVRNSQGHLQPLSGSAAWAICKERGRKAGIQPPAPHDLRRTWTGDLLEAGVDLATVQKMAGHASVSTTGRYDRRDHAVQRNAAGQLHVPYVAPEGEPLLGG
jgi:integrase